MALVCGYSASFFVASLHGDDLLLELTCSWDVIPAVSHLLVAWGTYKEQCAGVDVVGTSLVNQDTQD